MMLRNFFFLCLIAASLSSCTTSVKSSVELQQGKRSFENGYYKSAMRDLLPAAAGGNAEAQYAVGYMYYYGYGVTQDTDVGHFWIKRAANQHYMPAIKALELINKNQVSVEQSNNLNVRK